MSASACGEGNARTGEALDEREALGARHRLDHFGAHRRRDHREFLYRARQHCTERGARRGGAPSGCPEALYFSKTALAKSAPSWSPVKFIHLPSGLPQAWVSYVRRAVRGEGAPAFGSREAVRVGVLREHVVRADAVARREREVLHTRSALPRACIAQ